MVKVPFTRRVSDFFTQGHWDVFVFHRPWTIQLGVQVFIDSAPGFHFDAVGFNIDFWTWTLGISWVDNN